MSDLSQRQAKANKAIEQLIAQLRQLNDQYFDNPLNEKSPPIELNQDERPLTITDKSEAIPPSSP